MSDEVDSLFLNDSIISHDGNTTETQECNLVYMFIIYGPMYGIFSLFGLVGNTLSYAVLHRHRVTVSNYLLKALAVADNLFILSASLSHMYHVMCMYFGLEKQYLAPYEPYIQRSLWPLAHATQMGTVWMMVLVAANRYIAVCMPLQAPRLCTMFRVKLQVFLMATLVVVYTIPRCFEFNYVTVTRNITNESGVVIQKQERENHGLIRQQVYNILYENILYIIFVFLLPLVVIIFLNWHLVRELKAAQKCRETLTSRTTADENNITLVMIIIIVTFIVCQTPASINQILYYSLDETNKINHCTPYMKFFNLSNLLVLMNSSVNFIIYCVYRKQFQNELMALLCRREQRRQRNFSNCTYSGYLTREPMSTNSCRQNSEQMPLHTSCNGNTGSTSVGVSL